MTVNLLLGLYQAGHEEEKYTVPTMTERFQPNNLTNRAQNPYPESRDIFMANEPGQGENQPANGKEPQVSPKTPDQKRAELEEASRALRGLPPDVLQKLAEELTLNIKPPVYSTKESRATVGESLGRTIEAGMGTEARLVVGAPPAADVFEADAATLARELTDSVFKSIASMSAVPGADRTALYRQMLESFSSRSNTLRDRISDIQDIPANAERRAPLIEELNRLIEEKERLGRHLSRMEADEPRGLTADEKREIREIEEMPAGSPAEIEARRVRIRGIFNKHAPEDEALDDRILRLIARDEVVTEQFVSRLTISELEGEQWQMKGFYSSINYDKFIRVSGSVQADTKHKEMLALVEATTAFHNMNYIIKRNFERFGDSAESLQADHFQVLMSIRGMDAVVEMYEEAYQAHLGANTRITDDDFLAMDIEVSRALDSINASGQIIGMAGAHMEEWELRRAKILGRSFFRVLLRSSELAVLSDLEESADPALFTSVAQRGPTQILNNLKFTGVRFRPNEELGGPELLRNALAENRNRRDKRMQLRTLMGTDVDMRESQMIISARGVMASWRNAEAILHHIRFEETFMDTDGIIKPRETNVVDFFVKNHREAITALGDMRKGVNTDGSRIRGGESDEKFDARKKEATHALFAPLIDNTSVALGLLVSPSYLQVPTELKEILWEKSAELNPQMMASLLTRLELNPEGIMRSRDEHQRLLREALGGDTAARNRLMSWAKTDEQKAGLSQAFADPTEANQAEALNRLDGIRSLEDILLETWGDPEQQTVLGGGQLNNFRRRIETKGDELVRLKVYPDRAKNAKVRARILELEEEIDRDRIAYSTQEIVLKGLLRNENWVRLKKKIRIAHYARLNDEQARLSARNTAGDFTRLNEPPRTLESYLVGDLALDVNERTVYDEIVKSGKEIAPDLARVRQADAWFINDVPFQIANWNMLGQFYDRTVNDLGNFQKGTNGLLKVLSKPFTAKPEETLEAFREGIEGSGGVIGNVNAQKNQEPVFIAWMDMMQEYSWARQKIISATRHALRKPTSRAQEIAGLHAPSYDEDATFALLEEAHGMGVLRTENKNPVTGEEEWNDNLEHLIKKYNVGTMNRLVWSKIRDLGPFFFISLIVNFFKEVASSK